MNTDPELEMRLLTLVQAVRDSRDEAARTELNELLRADGSARAALAKLMVNEHALISRLREESIAAVLEAEPVLRESPARRRWISWSPLSTAAGLVLGLFSASVVFAYMVPRAPFIKRIAVAVADPGFEKADSAIAKRFPVGPGSWAADDAEVTRAPDGGRVLALRPWERNPYSRVVQIVDVSRLTAEGEKELVLAASFRTSDPQHASRYKLRLFGFAESTDAVPPFPLETKESGIVTLSQVLDVPAGTNGWQRFSTKMPMPSGVKSVVIWIGASTRPQPGPKVTHFVDDVTLTLDVHQPAAR